MSSPATEVEVVDRYVPHARQREAHSVQLGPVILYAGGYGSGKTLWLCKEGERESRFQPQFPIVAVAPTYKMVAQVLMATLARWLPGTGGRWPK